MYLDIKYSNPADIQEEKDLEALLDELDSAYSQEELKPQQREEVVNTTSSLSPEVIQKINAVCAVKKPVCETLRKAITTQISKPTKIVQKTIDGYSYRNPSEVTLEKAKIHSPWCYEYYGAEGYTPARAGMLFGHTMLLYGQNNNDETIEFFKGLMYETGLAENSRFKRNTDATLRALFNWFFERYDPIKANNYHVIGKCNNYVNEDFETLETRVPQEAVELYEQLADTYLEGHHIEYQRGNKNEKYQMRKNDIVSALVQAHGKIDQGVESRKHEKLPWFKVALVESAAEQADRREFCKIVGRHEMDMKFVRETIIKLFGAEVYKKACTIGGKESKRLYKVHVAAVNNVVKTIKKEINSIKEALKALMKAIKKALSGKSIFSAVVGVFFICYEEQYYISTNKSNKKELLKPPWWLRYEF